MAGKSNIEWTGHSWNPLAGCSVLTPGCKRCYAMKMAARLEAMGQALYAGLTQPTNGGAVWTGVMRKAPEHVLLAPLKRKVPTTYFVNSMSDLFHENVPDAWIDETFDVMARCPQHTFQVLTKRSARMRGYVVGMPERRAQFACHSGLDDIAWPLPNVWLGVSTERQQEADERIPDLLNTPAAIRFISAEPLLGPINLRGWPYAGWDGDRRKIKPAPSLDWVIVGGESGGGSRPFDLQLARSLVGQCAAAGVACFVKQLGARPIDSLRIVSDAPALVPLMSVKGGDPAEWPEELRVRQMPTTPTPPTSTEGLFA